MNDLTPVYLTIAVFGLAVGSFLNVVIYRVPREESLVAPASHCPSCQMAIKPWHNIPVFAWLFLRGRCSGCKARISIRYPLVEAGTSLLFVAMTIRFGLSLELPAYLYLAAIAIALAMIDLDVSRLPDSIILPSYVVAVLMLLPAGVGTGNFRAERGLLAMLTLMFVYLALALIYPSGMGFGDVKLAGVLGLYLGWNSWGSVVIGTFAGLLIGAAVGALLLVLRRYGRQLRVPFGPSMLSGAVLSLFIAAPITAWYASIIPTAV
jgi:leader peptidase (prepilin peptidase)/N-methyltransferase